ncbi:unnamed protein product [Malus baccata var. baccata]
MLFYLITLNLANVLREIEPIADGENIFSAETLTTIDAWKHNDFLCINDILNALDDSLYDKKYKTEDAGSKKFVVGKFLDYKMVDSKSVVSQTEDLQKIIHDIHVEGMIINESFQVASIIEKLPPSWKEFKSYLKHKRKEMTLEDLIIRLRIEEDNRKNDKGMQGHRAQECRHRRDQGPGNQGNNNRANLIEHNVNAMAAMISEINLVSNHAISEINLVSDHANWWIDTGATRHVYGDKNMFSSYQKIEGNKQLFMGNAFASVVVGIEKCVLKFTYGKGFNPS